MTTTYKGKCFCGAVAVEATGAPQAMGYCHCDSCRSWSAAPVNGFTLWAADSVRVTEGAELIGTYHKTENSYRKFCTRCGGHVMTDHPPFGMVDVYAATIPDLAFAPTLHVYYSEKVLRIADGLPKFADFPEAFGGTGAMLPE
jgi:hypothetical protein